MKCKMSLDLYMEVNKCKTCGHSQDIVEFNCTYNCAPMWRAIFPEHDRMIPIEGLTGKEARPMLWKAKAALEKDPEKFKALNPENGFGSYESFKSFIDDLICASLKFHKYTWEAWR
jgi:hypothetical protein